MTNGLSVSDITPLGERPADIWRGRTGATSAGWIIPFYNAYDYIGGTATGTDTDRVGIQAALDAANAAGGGIVFVDQGSYGIGSPGLTGYPNVTLTGAGRETTIFLALANSINMYTVTGTASDSTYEVAHASPVVGIEFNANSHTGVEGVAWIGVAYFNVNRCTFRGLAIGSEYYGSLQGRFDDCKFLSNIRGIKYDAQTIGYYGGTLPPNRVIVSWSTFYQNTSHAIDYSGGQQLIIESSEFGANGTIGDATTSAIKVSTSGDSHGPGLVGNNLWLESNHGLAVVELGGTSIAEHALTDCWLAYSDSTYSISVDGSTAAQTLVARNVRHDAVVSPATVSTWRSAGGTTYLDAEACDGSTSGSWTAVRAAPLLSGQLVSDLSQWLALRLPNLTTTQRNAIASPTAGMVIWNTSTVQLEQYTGSAWAAVGGGTGTVTSVGLTVPAEFSVSGSPVTGSGTLAVTKATESANTVWAGPTSGSAAQPTFRALTAADLTGAHVAAPLTASDGSGGWVLVFTPTGDCIMV